MRKLKTHCYMGHEYTPDNTTLDSRGNRCCRACARENGRKRLREFRIREAIAFSSSSR